MSTPQIYRERDRVRIVTPKIFVRCGYPWDKVHVMEKIFTDDDRKRVYDLVASFGLSDGSFKILNELAYQHLRKHRYGGRDRTIHSVEMPELRGSESYVRHKKVVNTGRYVAGGGCGDDYDPAYVTNRESHVILGIDIPRIPSGVSKIDFPERRWEEAGELWIEAENVEMVEVAPR